MSLLSNGEEEISELCTQNYVFLTLFITTKCKHTNIFEVPKALQLVPSRKKVFDCSCQNTNLPLQEYVRQIEYCLGLHGGTGSSNTCPSPPHSTPHTLWMSKSTDAQTLYIK
jgi:hypothetical protein